MSSTTSFEFSGYDVDKIKGEFRFHYTLSFADAVPILFTEAICLPNSQSRLETLPQNLLENILDSLHLTLGISYWKTYCPRELKLKTITLSKEQADFWNTVYIKGMGEFYYKNQIDFRDLVSFPFSDKPAASPTSINFKNRSLVAIGGGKDSIVTAELLKSNQKEFSAFTLGRHPIQEETITLLDVLSINIDRKIDPQLFELNKKEDVYNGHVPISTIYHFVGVLAAALYDYRYLVFSNERSSNYGNTTYLGQEINHQVSKSFEFENLIQEYIQTFISPDVTPFSLLRPLHEIKIAEIFSRYQKYFPLFSSCNRNFKIRNQSEMIQRWCGECPKCAFIFCLLAAFLPKEEVISIFQKDLFAQDSLIGIYKDLLGLGEVKPFDCVGTPEETQLAFYLANQKGDYHDEPAMKMFLAEVLPNLTKVEKIKSDLMSVSSEHLVPEEFLGVFKNLE